MVYLIEQALRSTITGLNFVERYGALVRAVPNIITDPETGSKKMNYFPISYYVSTADCFDAGMERHLVPDESVNSVVYWEHQGNSNFTRDSNASIFSGLFRMRLVCWVNLPALGFNEILKTDELELVTAHAILSSHGMITTIGGNKISIGVNSVTPVVRNETTVFSRYVYADKAYVYTYPYGFFALDCQFKLSISEGCISDINLGTEIKCVQIW